MRLAPAMMETEGARGAVREWPAMVLAAGVFATLSVLAAVFSKGFLEADATTHYLYARFAAQEGHYVTNVWGRPFCTTIYLLPAFIGGRMGVRLASLAIALVVGWMAYRIARNQGYRRPGLALIFLIGQPLVFLHSFSELTELPFALLLAMGLWAYQEKRWWAFAVVISLMPTARPEGFGFLLLGAAALVLHRRWYWAPLLVVPLVLWSWVGWVQHGAIQPWYVKAVYWLPEHWPYSGKSLYKAGYLVHFLVLLPMVVSPAGFPAMWIGVWRSLRLAAGKGWRGVWGAVFGADQRERVQWLIALIPLGILGVHSVLYWRGRMASNGEIRYLMVAAPMWALLAAAGWEWLFERMRWRSMLGWAGIAVLLPGLANAVYHVVPIGLSQEAQRSRQAAEWVRNSPLRVRYPKLIATEPTFYYFMDLSMSDPRKSARWHRDTLRGREWGVMIIWDPVYGVFNANEELSISAKEIVEMGWVPVHVFHTPPEEGKGGALERIARKIQNDGVGDWVVFLSPVDMQGRETDMGLAVPLP